MKSTKFKLNLEKNDEKVVWNKDALPKFEKSLKTLYDEEPELRAIKFSDEEIKRFEDNLKNIKVANSYGDDNIIYEYWKIENPDEI